MRRWLRRLSVGWLPPSVPPSGAGLCLGASVLAAPLNAVEGSPTPGLRRSRCPWGPLLSACWPPLELLGCLCAGLRSGHGPQASSQLPGHGHAHALGLWASCPEAPGTLTEPHGGFPTAVLDDCGWGCASPWQRSADVSGLA